MRVRAVGILIGVLGLGIGMSTATAGPPGGGAGKAAPAAGTEDKKKEAQRVFYKGLNLLKQEDFDAALAEFLRSREIFPTRAATKNAAICLRKLRRYDEALDMLETLLKDHKDLPPAERASAEAEIKELRGNVGRVEIKIPESDAAITIDGRDRGKTPLAAPLRVAAGTHLVRIQKEGYAPLEKRITVAGDVTVAIEGKLAPLTPTARLKVSEKNGKEAQVVVDGETMGDAPWEGKVSPGPHAVSLVGKGSLGTQPAAATVRNGATEAVELELEQLDSYLRVEPEPANAVVSLDGVRLGEGPWVGRVRAGDHRIVVEGPGLGTTVREISLDKGDKQIVKIRLDGGKADTNEQPRSGAVLEVQGGASLGTGLGGDLAASCTQGCEKGTTIPILAVLRGGYLFKSGAGLSLDAGYFRVSQELRGREITVQQYEGTGTEAGKGDDRVTIHGLIVGASVYYHSAGNWPLQVRLGLGALFGASIDQRSGTIAAATQPYWATYRERSSTSYMYGAPEIRLGYRVARRLEISLGVQVLLMYAIGQPTWEDQNPVNSPTLGPSEFGAQTLTSKVLVFPIPSLGLSMAL